MQIFQNIPLALHSTMRLGGQAAYSVDVDNRETLTEAVDWAGSQNLPVIMIGSGSNVVWRDEGFKGLLLVNKIPGYNVFKEDDSNAYLTVGGGENWDSVVEKSVAAGLTGIEALSLIPGTAGAAPVQNIGAYGQELSQTLVSVEAYDNQARQFVNIPKEDCSFSYRSSRFKTTDRGRFFITGLTLHLNLGQMEPPFYATLQTYLDSQNIKDYGPASIRNAVISIRQGRLPDPAKVANNGSFFTNPLINKEQARQISESYPGLKHWPMDDGRVKVAAAWLVENAGFKNFHDQETGMATWHMQSLVLVNEHAKSTADLIKFRQKIITAVKNKFGIELEQEPELLP